MGISLHVPLTMQVALIFEYSGSNRVALNKFSREKKTRIPTCKYKYLRRMLCNY